MRISGLASGFDTDEMVKQLMQAERIKVDRVEQNRQTILWRQESYNNMNKAFANFILNTQKDLGLKKTSSTGSMFDSSYKNADYLKKVTSSSEGTATAIANSKDVNGSYSFEVKKLATEARFSVGEMKDSDIEGSKYIEFKINGSLVKVGDGTKKLTMDDVAKAINNAKNSDGSSLGITSFYDKSNERLFIQATDGRENISFEATNNVRGQALVAKFVGDKAINNPSEQSEIIYNGVSLKYDSNNIVLNGLNIELKSVSDIPVTINVSTNTEGIMEKIEKLVADYNDLVDMASGLVNEKVYRDYKPLSAEERKAMNEEDLKLWDEKAKSGLLNRDETLQRTLQRIRTDLYEKVDISGSFDHITQIGISTEKYARGSAGGKLQIDTDKLRKAIEEDPEGVMELLFKEPKATEYTGQPKPKNLDKKDEKYKLPDGEFNTEEWDKDMAKYTEELDKYNKAMREHEMENKALRKSQGGIFTKVYDNLIDGMKDIIEKSGTGKDSDLYRNVKSNMLIDFVTKGSISDLDKSVTEMNKKIDNLNILLARKEDSHYAKFTAMEKAMYQMQNQSSWLAQQFM